METKTLLCVGLLLLVLCKSEPCFGQTERQYMEQRRRFVEEEKAQIVGAAIKLSEEENEVNNILMKLKLVEIEAARNNGTAFPPAVHFFKAKPLIDASPVFKILKDMPKGGVLHLHDCCSADPRWLIRHATYDPNCYMCINKEGNLIFHYFPKPPGKEAGCDWQRVVSARLKSSNVTEFDENLYRKMTLIVDDPMAAYKNQDVVWQNFMLRTATTFSLITYSRVFRDYCLKTLNDLYKDNVQYAEIRALLPKVYELDGTVHDSDWALAAYQSCVDEFKRSHPDFLGAKFIFISVRSRSKEMIAADITTALKLLKKYPRVMAGFDLVSQEDKGHTLLYFIDQLLAASQRSNQQLKYFFHAGETNWEGTEIDENLIDAVLLNTSRIGHAYAITKHPGVMKVVKEKSIALEVNPISNQVLMLVSDLRNHPLASLMAMNYPIVISSDDPAMWGITGLSYDFYEAFMGLGGGWADLRTLKQLIINSIRYSAMSDEEKADAFALWNEKWKRFIQRTLARDPSKQFL